MVFRKPQGCWMWGTVGPESTTPAALIYDYYIWVTSASVVRFCGRVIQRWRQYIVKCASKAVL